ncbi:hypothetical protein PAXRUDRAFT_175938 [Paxillus rubicundulus Ve08.2h10]|uniref:Integrase catalytic domain-containing protein n=1 Tax=Paxillus rubicundulus Ve08.2h10 TaxID=930991 RepID=A0A0D0CTM0_9AGAM|nr:hypothetical protein PAXRUDRAFT_175938 [Paxillus rubicundulus Ve08.2h10]
MDIMDDFSSYMWATGLKVSVFQSDNSKLKCNDLKAWFQSHGMTQQFTSAYTSAQNGCIEQVHHTLMGKA